MPEDGVLLPRGLHWAGALLAPLYGAGVALHRAFARKKWAPITTICVGNLTTGGTGKTPAVIYLARELVQLGRKPAILMRGYKAQGGDEALEAGDALKGLDIPIILGADRFQSALQARAQNRDVILLDDGFQHWRLARDLDIVLIDASDPFGGGMGCGGALIPQGRLRKPVSGLARAGVILLTRSDASIDTTSLRETIRNLAPNAAILTARHAPAGVRALKSSAAHWSVSKLRGARVVAACGIGNPKAFLKTLKACGAEILASRNFDDHHEYAQRDLDELSKLAESHGAGAVVVTEKDAVKLAALNLPERVELLALKIEFNIDGANELWTRVAQALARGDKRLLEKN